MGITEKNGIPHVWGVPCAHDKVWETLTFPLKDTYTGWICPHCLGYLFKYNTGLHCINSCHLAKKHLPSVYLKEKRFSVKVNFSVKAIYHSARQLVKRKYLRRWITGPQKDRQRFKHPIQIAPLRP